MSETQPTPTIALDTRHLAARVVLPQGLGRDMLNPSFLASLARERDVEINGAAMKVLERVVEEYTSSGGPISEVFQTATPPDHGRNGWIEWMPGYDPDAPHADDGADSDQKVDFYSHQSFVRVCRQDHVATLHPPTPGTDGRDVCRQTLPAKPGLPFVLETDASLSLLADGRIIAQSDGLLRFDGHKLRVEPVLEVEGAVDFSTGNIDFDGEVIIRRDIRDKFRVKATGNVNIDGLIDASHIRCGGDLTARRGVAGRDEGTLEVGGDANIGYVDRASGRIAGSLYFAREIIQSTIVVLGDLRSEQGAIIGGRVSVEGNARFATLGSASDTPTEFRLCAEPERGSPAAKAAAEVESLRVRIERMEQELAQVEANAGAANTMAADRATELAFEIDDARKRLGSLRDDHPRLGQSQGEWTCESVLEVTRQIHGRVSLTIGGQHALFSTGVKGPLRLWLDRGRGIMCQIGEGTPQPIRALTGVTCRQAA